MTLPSDLLLTARERQIMNVVYRRKQATAAEIQAELPAPPGYSAVRAMLAKLTKKGHLRSENDGPRYVYLPVVPRDEAQQSALGRLVSTFFGGSPVRAATALLQSAELSADELAELEELLKNAREGKG